MREQEQSRLFVADAPTPLTGWLRSGRLVLSRDACDEAFQCVLGWTFCFGATVDRDHGVHPCRRRVHRRQGEIIVCSHSTIRFGDSAFLMDAFRDREDCAFILTGGFVQHCATAMMFCWLIVSSDAADSGHNPAHVMAAHYPIRAQILRVNVDVNMRLPDVLVRIAELRPEILCISAAWETGKAVRAVRRLQYWSTHCGCVLSNDRRNFCETKRSHCAPAL
jgi:hypothetical protein